MQYLFGSYLVKQMAHLVGRLSHIPLPQPVLRSIIQVYTLGMCVNIDEVLEPRDGFLSFGDFFGRRLKSEARPVCGDKDALVSPCDGEVIDLGKIDGTGSAVFRIENSRDDGLTDGYSESSGLPALRSEIIKKVKEAVSSPPPTFFLLAHISDNANDIQRSYYE